MKFRPALGNGRLLNNRSESALGYFLDSSDGIGLRTLLSLNDVKLDLVPFFQTLVPIELDRAVMDKHVGSIVPADKAVTLRVIEPLHFAFELSH